jgi:hypothetical protein
MSEKSTQVSAKSAAMFNLAISQLKSKGYNLDPEAKTFLREKIDAAVFRIEITDGEKNKSLGLNKTKSKLSRKERQRKGFIRQFQGFRDMQYIYHNGKRYKMYNDPFGLAILKITRALIRTNDTNLSLSQNDIQAALKDLCPIWPFC